MNKLFILFSLLSTLNFHGRAQSIADLLVELELDEQKLSSMKNTLQEMYQGFTELKQGYTHIRDIAKDNFNLHQGFLDALLAISPAVRSDPRITTIINSEYRIVSGYQTANTRWTAAGVFTGQELGYIINTYSAVFQQCLQSVEGVDDDPDRGSASDV